MSLPRNIELKEINGRIVLRPPVKDNASEIYDAVMVSLDELMPWMDWCTPDYSIEITLEWLDKLPSEWEKGNNYQFSIFDILSGQFLGSCGINHINQAYLLANLGYWVRSDRTGEGIATQAARLVAKFGFQALELRRIEIVTAEENWASRRVAERAGASFEGILRRRIKIGDRNIDAAMHSLIPEDFQ
ncbi:MAG: GNAT family N-acetyltransferase [Anaerolineales bacterium]|nr:GNAT family N-acetyltransferase [Anaerolineales bacterium]